MFDNRYLYACARTKVLESRLIDENIVMRMMAAGTVREGLLALSETRYATLLASLERDDDYEALILLELMNTKQLMTEVFPDKSLMGLVFLKYDIHNIKVLLKGSLVEEKSNHLLMDIGTVPAAVLKEKIAAKNLSGLHPEIVKALNQLFEEDAYSMHPRKIDFKLDQALYNALYSLSKKSRSDFILSWVKVQIDLINMKTFVRMKASQRDYSVFSEVFIENGKVGLAIFESVFSEPLSALKTKLFIYDYDRLFETAIASFDQTETLGQFEKLAEDFLKTQMAPAKYIAFGIEPIISYAIAVENETKLIRLLMVAIKNGMDLSRIKERLSGGYV